MHSIDICELDRPYSVHQNARLLDAVKIFAQNPHVHRVAVINEQSKLQNIIAQSRYIYPSFFYLTICLPIYQSIYLSIPLLSFNYIIYII